MAITNGYATLAEFKLWADISSSDSDDDTVIEDIIEAASRWIDDETGRTFYARTETRYFDVPSGRKLKLDDDLLTITTLTNGDSNTIDDSSEIDLVPKNVAPYYAIRIKAGSAYYWSQDSSGNIEDVISVAGTWGYAATAPHDIRQACLITATNMYKRRFGEGEQGATLTPAGVVLSPVGIPSQAAMILRRYKRRS